jgi:hypothetical protein
MSDALHLQRQVDDMLKLGLILSIVWCAGIGSLMALINGLRAMRIIRASNGDIAGIGRAWWCIIVGCIGVGWWLPSAFLLVRDAFIR